MQFNIRLWARAQRTRGEEQGARPPASRPDCALFHQMPSRCFVQSADVPRVIPDACAVCLGTGNNALLLRARQARDLGPVWN